MARLGERDGGINRRRVLAGAGTTAVLGSGAIAAVVGAPDPLGGSEEPVGGTSPGTDGGKPGAQPAGASLDGTLDISDAEIESANGEVSSLLFQLDGSARYESISGDPDTLVLRLFAGWPDEPIDQPDHAVGAKSFEIDAHDTLGPVDGQREYAFERVDLLDSTALAPADFAATESEPTVRDVAVTLVAQLTRSAEVVVETALTETFNVTVINRSGLLDVEGKGSIIDEPAATSEE